MEDLSLVTFLTPQGMLICFLHWNEWRKFLWARNPHSCVHTWVSASLCARAGHKHHQLCSSRREPVVLWRSCSLLVSCLLSHRRGGSGLEVSFILHHSVWNPMSIWVCFLCERTVTQRSNFHSSLDFFLKPVLLKEKNSPNIQLVFRYGKQLSSFPLVCASEDGL